jgi:ribosomal-protein-alanine N-acetyltransferase
LILKYSIHTPENKLDNLQIDTLVSFLEQHLDEYGDKKEDILKSVHYAMSSYNSPGGFVVIVKNETQQIMGATIVNKTGMQGYIPPYILVYIAVHKDGRGLGIGHTIMTMALKEANGDMALHVEPNNPAKRLYEKLGFTNKYLEMRYQKPN